MLLGRPKKVDFCWFLGDDELRVGFRFISNASSHSNLLRVCIRSSDASAVKASRSRASNRPAFRVFELYDGLESKSGLKI